MGMLVPHEFVNWDDDINVASNPAFNPPTLDGVLHFWKEPFAGLYVPVTYTAWGLLAAGAYSERVGLNPLVFHGFNVLLHAVNALLVFSILRRLLPGKNQASIAAAAAAGAVLFAVHPVQVEPVGWVTGLKDVLCGFFSLLSLLGFVVAFENAGGDAGENEASGLRWPTYALATAAYALALLSKPSAVVVPFMAALIGVVLLRRRLVSVGVTLLPWVVLALMCIALTRHEQPTRDTDGGDVSVWSRPQVAADTVTFYLGKIAFPLHLTVDYGRTPAVAVNNPYRLLVWLPPLVLAAVAWLFRRRLPGVFVGLGVALLGVAPVLGFVSFDFQQFSTVADRYLYLSMFGVALACAALLESLPPNRWLAPAAIILAALTVRSIAQTRHWYDGLTLFRHGVAENPTSWVCHNNLAIPLGQAGLTDEALAHARRAVELNPSYATGNVTLAGLLTAKGQLAEAETIYRKVLTLSPDNATALASLAGLSSVQNRPDDAIQFARRAIEVDPRNANAHWVLGTVLDEKGQHEQAVGELSQAYEISADPRAEVALARALMHAGLQADARQHLEHALSLSPDLPDARDALKELDKSLR